MVVVGVALLLEPALTCAEAGPDISTLCLRWLPSVATYGGGVSPSMVGTKTPLAHVVVSPIATCSSGVFLPPTGADAELTLKQLALCGDIIENILL